MQQNVKLSTFTSHIIIGPGVNVWDTAIEHYRNVQCHPPTNRITLSNIKVTKKIQHSSRFIIAVVCMWAPFAWLNAKKSVSLTLFSTLVTITVKVDDLLFATERMRELDESGRGEVEQRSCIRGQSSSYNVQAKCVYMYRPLECRMQEVSWQFSVAKSAVCVHPQWNYMYSICIYVDQTRYKGSWGEIVGNTSNLRKWYEKLIATPTRGPDSLKVTRHGGVP